MSRTNEHIADAEKAVEAHKRNKNRPEGADHLPLQDEKDHQPEDGDASE